MPRRQRTHLDGMPLHIVQRGHNRNACFFETGDYRAYLRALDIALRDAQCDLHAYVLMTNHVHLLITPRHAALVPRLLIALGRRYVHHVNARYGRTGTLWDSRYRSSLVDSDAYLLMCMRYIELNPVRAGIAGDPGEYRWSSYQANALAGVDPLVSPHATWQELGRDDVARRAAYRELFRGGRRPEAVAQVRTALERGEPLGSRRFVDWVERALGRRCVARPPGRPRTAGAATAETVPAADAGDTEPGSVSPVSRTA